VNTRQAPRSGEAESHLRSVREGSGRFRFGLGLTSAAILAAAVGSTLLPVDPRQQAAASLAGYLYWLGIGGGAAIVLGILRLTRAEWRRPLARPAEFLALLVPLAVTFYPLALSWRDALTGHGNAGYSGTLWPWGNGSQGITIDMVFAAPMVLLVGLLFWFGIGPDLRLGRGRMPAGRLRVWSSFELVFLIAGLAWFGWGFGMTQIPGWETTLFGPYFVATSLLHGAAAVGVLSIGLSRILGLETWVTPHQLGQLSKLMIGLVLIWFYVHFAEFITVWYGHVPREMAILRMRTIEAHPALFTFVAVATFPVPLLYFSFPGLRRRVGGVFAVCSLILAAGLVEWALVFSPGAGVVVPTGFLPMLILPGALGLLLALVLRFVPPLSVWEIEEGIRARSSISMGEATIATYPLIDLPGRDETHDEQG